METGTEKLQELQREITCGICRSYFSEPVTISCGHSFCRACLSWSWTLGATPSSCPECRQVPQVREMPAINRRLAELTDLGKQLCSHHLQSQCARHKLVLKLFCEDDQTALCVRCSQSPEHGAHKLSPIEEVAHDCRLKLQDLRSHLGKHLEEAERLLAQEEKLAFDWHQMIAGEYAKMHHFLMEAESRCLERPKQDDKTSQDRLFQNMQTLQDFMVELQEAGHQPNVGLLQEVKPLLRRSGSVMSQRAKAVCPELKEYPITGMIERLNRSRVDLTIDPSSVNSGVTVSEDLKSVKAGEGWKVEAKHPENALCHFVFAEQAFSSGRQYWEVDVTQLPQWILGIHTPCLRKRRDRNKNSCASVFLLCCVKKEGDYYLQSYPGSLNHRVKDRLPRVGVYLDYTFGTLVFYNVFQRCFIYRFSPILFTEPVTPVFSPGPPLPGTKAGPMTLCPVDSHLCACCYSCL